MTYTTTRPDRATLALPIHSTQTRRLPTPSSFSGRCQRYRLFGYRLIALHICGLRIQRVGGQSTCCEQSRQRAVGSLSLSFGSFFVILPDLELSDLETIIGGVTA
ncbi:hypothetical protein X798_02078 [Onchocerca flexuosa]|uniref:Uncharacterized protein n=1 Tax=Onchocerca flexuosa TaxID=387005 RepID=A0A238C0P1_9BILA|nr:hypothetical protein X798_02078 [Onchocerca flexuosa]